MNALELDVRDNVLAYLKPYTDQFHLFRAPHPDHNMNFRGKVRETDLAETLVLNVHVNHDHKQAFITNVFMPEFMRHKCIGKTLIAIVFAACKKYGYHLILSDVVPGFHRRMLNRGAVALEADYLLITDETRLTP